MWIQAHDSSTAYTKFAWRRCVSVRKSLTIEARDEAEFDYKEKERSRQRSYWRKGDSVRCRFLMKEKWDEGRYWETFDCVCVSQILRVFWGIGWDHAKPMPLGNKKQSLIFSSLFLTTKNKNKKEDMTEDQRGLSHSFNLIHPRKECDRNANNFELISIPPTSRTND